MKRLKLIICCAVLLSASYAFGVQTMTSPWAEIDAAITSFLTQDTAAEHEAMITLSNLQGAVTDAQVPDDITITETDPVTGAITGIVKANGSGTISAASAGTDYLTPTGVGTGLTALNGENISNDTIDDDSLDFGTGADQISAVDIVLEDTGTLITATEVEGALAEHRAAINLNTAKVTNATHSGEVTGDGALTISADSVDDTNIDWGTAAGKVSAADILIGDADENFTATEVETALDELYDTKEPSLTVASQAEMEAGTVTELRSMSPLRVAQAIAAQAYTSTRTVTAHGSVSSGTETFTPGVSTVTVAGAFTWAFGSWPASGTEGTIRAYITNGGAAVITGWSAIIWEGGVEPTLQASGLDVLIFTTLDGGTTVYGFVAGEDMQ